VGPAVSGGKRKEAVPVRKTLLGCGLLAVLGRIRCPWPFSIFPILFFFSFFFFFVFLFLPYLLQIKSKQGQTKV
jgi:hypothetical protein